MLALKKSEASAQSLRFVPGRGVMAAVIAALLLALLYCARDVLIPITLAVFLSLIMTPFVRSLRRVGLGQRVSVLTALAIVMCGLTGIAVVLVGQIVHIAHSLPQYESNLQLKLQSLENLRRGGVNIVMSGADDAPLARADVAATNVGVSTPLAARVGPAPASPWRALQGIAADVRIPLESTGIVLVVFIFALLEHEALRDRFIRMTGSADIRATTIALQDAGLRLSHFFASQFLVNLGVGVVIGLGLMLVGCPDAPLWAALTVVLRFVPFVGVWIAAAFATLLAAAVSPEWTLALFTMGVFLLAEIIASQVVEPHFYGHSTGLSPLTIVIGAIFWNWLWGPVGLIVSTPLTLCLLVAGRHIKSLHLLNVVLGDTPALTPPQHFYQRALSGDPDEVISGAREFLKRNSFAVYCDSVLIPALQLAAIDHEAGLIDTHQEATIRRAILMLITNLGETPMRRSHRRFRRSVLDDVNIGRALRREREMRHGRWQGPSEVPPGSVVVCIALHSGTDELVAELLARVLRAQGIDARHFANDVDAPTPEGASPGDVSIGYLVGTRASQGETALAKSAAILRARCPEARIVGLMLPHILAPAHLVEAAEPGAVPAGVVDRTSSSFVEALQICTDWNVLTKGRSDGLSNDRNT
jgi:predicted PurR-regulated permease PerM